MSTIARQPGRSRGRNGTNYVNAVLTLMALLVIVPLALQASHEPPPPVAEFAPQVLQQVKQAPSQQASQFGNGSGSGEGGPGGGAGAPSPSPPPPPPTLNVPAELIKHCVGDPPRQIEDAQSPPCIPYWQPPPGGNGGATSPGVRADKITVGMPVDCDLGSQGQGESYLEYDDLIKFFNKRFEFYGRQLDPYCYQTSNGSAQQAQEEADADNMAQHDPPPFVTTMYRNGGGRYFVPRAGCVHHMISVIYYLVALTKQELNACPGYIYDYVMDYEGEAQMQGQWTCARLVPGNAVHANGDAAGAFPPKNTPRKFGAIFEPFYGDEPGSLKPLLDELKVCGVTIDDKDQKTDPVVDTTNSAIPVDPTQASSTMLQLKNDGVTSIECICNYYTLAAFMRAADSQKYYPEWLVTTYGGNDALFAQDLGGAPVDQLTQMFGLSMQPRQIPPAEEPYYQAMREVDQANTPKGPDSIDVEVDKEVYHNMLMLMSGIQMAGPHLTPKTFADGLANARFPNPDTPLREGHVGFAGYTYSMTIDAAEFWYGVNQQSPFPDTSGAWAICYVADGARHLPGQWTRGGDPFFGNNPCYGVH